MFVKISTKDSRTVLWVSGKKQAEQLIGLL